MNPGRGLDWSRSLDRRVGDHAHRSSTTRAQETEGYDFAAAVQELSQLFWLAETANACGWTSREEVLKFERFSLYFLAAHLSEQNVKALVSLVRTNGYESAVRRVAEEGSRETAAPRAGAMDGCPTRPRPMSMRRSSERAPRSDIASNSRGRWNGKQHRV
jgi:hypothetical protein